MKKKLEHLTEKEHLMRTKAVQKKIEEESKWEDDIMHSHYLGTGNRLLGHLPSLDETEGSE